MPIDDDCKRNMYLCIDPLFFILFLIVEMAISQSLITYKRKRESDQLFWILSQSLLTYKKDWLNAQGWKQKKSKWKKQCVNIKFWYRNIIDHEMKTELGTINGSKHKVQASCGLKNLKKKNFDRSNLGFQLILRD